MAGVKPKPVTTVPIRPALQTPGDTANAMTQAERQAIQSDLAWTGHYNGAVNGEVKLQLPGNRSLTAIVTIDALNELNLAVGQACTALIKSSHVLIAVND